MASSFVTDKANAILTAAFKTTQVYGSLHLADPTDTGSASCEVPVCYCYTRKAITFGDDAASRTMDNSADLTFDVATGGAWGTITHLGISSCSTATCALDTAYGSLTTPKTVGDGDQIKFSAGNIDITIAAGA
jgi:hypothetical protein